MHKAAGHVEEVDVDVGMGVHGIAAGGKYEAFAEKMEEKHLVDYPRIRLVDLSVVK